MSGQRPDCGENQGMHPNRDVPLKVAVEGVIAGMAGALALSALVVTGRTLMFETITLRGLSSRCTAAAS